MIKLISITQGAGELINANAQEVISYIARVSNPSNQLNFDTSAGLLKYCIKHEHWSIFEHAFMTLEINTTRGIAAQVLRHRSFTFQEFSQRYADTNLLSDVAKVPELRRQDTKNRQNSTDDLDGYLKLTLQSEIQEYFIKGQAIYNRLLSQGVAKECARFILPLATPTRLYISGSIRSWITYISLREKSGTQKEHMDIAKECKNILCEHLPIIADALGGNSKDWTI